MSGLNLVALFCDLLRHTNIEMEGFNISRCFHRLVKSNPKGCCVALRVYLDTRFDSFASALSEGEPVEENSFLRGHRVRREFEDILRADLMDNVIAEAATEAPFAFVEQVIPWFIRTINFHTERFNGRNQDTYPSDIFFSNQINNFYSDPRGNKAPSFVQSLVSALSHVAKNDRNLFSVLTKELSLLDIEATQAVLARAYIAASEEYAEDIYAYLLEDRRRFAIGPNKYDSCQLFRAAFTYGDTSKRDKLEKIIMNLKPDGELRFRHLGYSQILFLKSVAPSLLSPIAQRRLQELERRFPTVQPGPINNGSIGGWVRSPIGSEILERMSDKDLLNALRVYDESTGWGAPRSEKRRRDFLKGGLVELSRVLAEKAKENPERFYKLTAQFDVTIPLAYIAQILSGLAVSKAPENWVFEVAEKFAFRFIGDERISFCNSLIARADQNVPDKLLEIMTSWALNDPNPDPLGVTEWQNRNEWFAYGINSVRGAATQAVVICSLKGKPLRIEWAINLLHKAVLDPSAAVGACSLKSIMFLLNISTNRDQVLHLGQQVLNSHPVLLDDQFTYEFLSPATFYYFDRFGKYIEDMLASHPEHVRQQGARLAAQAALNNEEAKPLEKRVLAGDAVLRRGAAHIYAMYLGSSVWRQTCQEYLRMLMHDPDEEVQNQVALCFTYLEQRDVVSLRSFIIDYLKSPAFMRSPRHLIKYIQPSSTYEHELTLQVTENILQAIEAGKPIEIQIWDDDFIALPLAVYNRSHDDQMKNRAMDLFERALRLGFKSARQALQEWDEHRDWRKMLIL